MAITIHVYPSGKGWAVQRDDTKTAAQFPTQKAAIQRARAMVREKSPSQMIVHGRTGRLSHHYTNGVPKVQHSPVRSPRRREIEKAISFLALERLKGDSRPPRA
jgi:hypothetical protein